MRFSNFSFSFLVLMLRLSFPSLWTIELFFEVWSFIFSFFYSIIKNGCLPFNQKVVADFLPFLSKLTWDSCDLFSHCFRLPFMTAFLLSRKIGSCKYLNFYYILFYFCHTQRKKFDIDWKKIKKSVSSLKRESIYCFSHLLIFFLFFQCLLFPDLSV